MEKKNSPIWKILLNLVVLGIVFINIPQLTPIPLVYIMKLFIDKPKQTPPKNFDVYAPLVAVEHDINYDSNYSRGFLDIYKPTYLDTDQGYNKQLPVILWVPGGAYIGGNKSDISIYATMLASQDYVVAVMNYELAPKARYPEPIFQVQEAYEFLNKHQLEYNLKMDDFFLAGDSAGAQIAAQFALIHTRPDYRDLLDYAPMKATIAGMLLYCGIYDKNSLAHLETPFSLFRDQIAWAYLGRKDWHYYAKIQYASIVEMVDEHFPPSFITDGHINSFPEHADLLYQELRNKDVYVRQLSFPPERKLPHEYQFILDTEEGMKSFEYTLSFLESIRFKKD